jgi:hypothetical protein
VLAIRRLVDRGSKGIISRRRLLTDVKNGFHLFTRENYVCFDGLPYDYEEVQSREMLEKVNKGFFWGHTSGPKAHFSSRLAHEQFDRLSGILPKHRSRNDRLPKSLLAKIERWMTESGAEGLAEWSHAYLAHAGGPERRQEIANLQVTRQKLTEAIKALARVAEGLSAYVLFAGGRSGGGMMPVPQYGQFKKLQFPVMPRGGEAKAHQLWRKLSDERNSYLDDVGNALLPP